MKKSKKILKITIIILFLLLIIIYSILMKIKDKQKNYNIHDPEMPIVSSKNLVQDAYDGNIDTYDISARVQILFETYLPLVVSNAIYYDENKLNEFYEEQTSDDLIYKNMGINNYDEFQKFIEKLKELNCDLLDIESIEYNQESYVLGEYEDSLEFNVYYNNENNILKCKAYIPKLIEQNSELIIRFEILKVQNNQ